MKDQFRSDLHVGKVTAPVLVVHGENDFVVPMKLGKRLYDLIRAPKRFVSFICQFAQMACGSGLPSIGDEKITLRSSLSRSSNSG